VARQGGAEADINQGAGRGWAARLQKSSVRAEMVPPLPVLPLSPELNGEGINLDAYV